jgi:hypothetical protein
MPTLLKWSVLKSHLPEPTSPDVRVAPDMRLERRAPSSARSRQTC